MKTAGWILVALLAACGQPSADSSAQAALTSERELFRHILGDDEQLQAGRAIAISTVRLDELGAYGGGAVEPLLHDGGERLVPLSGASGVRAGMTLVRDGDSWKMARAGAANLTRAVAAARATAAGDEVSLVRIVGLQLDYFATRTNGELQLTALFDGAAGPAGQTEDARALFTRLAPLAAAAR